MEGKFKEAVEIYKRQINPVEARIRELKKALTTEQQLHLRGENEDEHEAIVKIRQTVRVWYEIEHRIIFFIATAYHSLEDTVNEELFFNQAQELRNTMLVDYENGIKFHSVQLERMMDGHKQELDALPFEASEMNGGLICGPLFERLETVEDLIFSQWPTIIEWRNVLRNVLTSAVDAMEDNATGEEFEGGIIAQELAMAYQDELRVLLVM